MTNMTAPTIRIDTFTIELMFQHLVRCPDVFSAGRAHLAPDLFNQADETKYLVVWNTALEYHERYGELVPHQYLSTQTASMMQASPLCPDEAVQDALRFVDWLFDEEENPAENINAAVGTDLLQQFLVGREVHKPIIEAAAMIQAGGSVDLDAIVAESNIKKAAVATISTPVVTPLSGHLEGYQERLEQLRGHELIGLKTGMQILDDRTCGLRGLMFVGAGPGVGKTVLALQTGINVCRHYEENNASVLYVSLDMPRDDMIDRMYCHLSGMDWKTYRLGSELHRRDPQAPVHTDHQQQQLDSAHRKFGEWGLDRRMAIVQRDELGPSAAEHISQMAQQLKLQTNTSRCLVIVDYFQLLPVDDGDAHQNELEQDKMRVGAVQRILAAIEDPGRPQGSAVLVITEARKPQRSSKSGNDNWSFDMESLMGSARLAYAPDAILLIRRQHTDEIQQNYGQSFQSSYDTPIAESLDQQGIAPLIFKLAKGRDGMTRGEWNGEHLFRQSTIQERLTQQPSSSLPIGSSRPTLAGVGNGQTDPGVSADFGLEDT